MNPIAILGAVGSTAVAYATSTVTKDVAKAILPAATSNLDKIVRSSGVGVIAFAIGHYSWKAVANEVNSTVNQVREAVHTNKTPETEETD